MQIRAFHSCRGAGDPKKLKVARLSRSNQKMKREQRLSSALLFTQRYFLHCRCGGRFFYLRFAVLFEDDLAFRVQAHQNVISVLEFAAQHPVG